MASLNIQDMELEKYPLNLVIVNNRRAMDMLASTRESMNNFIYICFRKLILHKISH